jgi:hypothetical protein
MAEVGLSHTQHHNWWIWGAQYLTLFQQIFIGARDSLSVWVRGVCVCVCVCVWLIIVIKISCCHYGVYSEDEEIDVKYLKNCNHVKIRMSSLGI